MSIETLQDKIKEEFSHMKALVEQEIESNKENQCDTIKKLFV